MRHDIRVGGEGATPHSRSIVHRDEGGAADSWGFGRRVWFVDYNRTDGTEPGGEDKGWIHL